MPGLALDPPYSDSIDDAASFHLLHATPDRLQAANDTDPFACPIRGGDAVIKRALDLSIATACLLTIFPLLLIVALCIRVESPGPVLFRQRRTGQGGAVIEIWKFRSMRHDTADSGGAVQTCRLDPRVTRVGRFIRSSSIDELPQLFNVVQGRMSLVGPRPHTLQTRCEGLTLAEVAPAYGTRYRVKPGLTGLAQVMGYRGELDSRAKLRGRVRFDRLYIDRWSPMLDLRILALTVLKVLRDRHAY